MGKTIKKFEPRRRGDGEHREAVIERRRVRRKHAQEVREFVYNPSKAFDEMVAELEGKLEDET
jgi:hypothetical protein